MGSGEFDRLSVSAGVFGSGSGNHLQVVDFADDPFSPSADAARIYRHPTRDESHSEFVSLTDPRNAAVHDCTITHPGRVRGVVDLP